MKTLYLSIIVSVLVFLTVGFTTFHYASAIGFSGTKSIDIKINNTDNLVFYFTDKDGVTINSFITPSSSTTRSLLMNVTSLFDENMTMQMSRDAYDRLSFTQSGYPKVIINNTEFPIEVTSSCDVINLVFPVFKGTQLVELQYPILANDLGNVFPQQIQLLRSVDVQTDHSGEKKFNVILKTDAIICNLSFFQEEKRMHIDVVGRSDFEDKGFLSVTVPHEMLGGTYTVLVDGKKSSFTEESYRNIQYYPDNMDVSIIAVNYTTDVHYPHYVDVVGTTVVPEFPFTILILLASFASVIALYRMGFRK